jgi:hypothetical protein
MIAGFAQTLRDMIGHGGIVFNAEDIAHGCDFMPLIAKNSSGSKGSDMIFFAVHDDRC